MDNLVFYFVRNFIVLGSILIICGNLVVILF